MTDDAYPEAWRPRGLPDTTTPEQIAAEKFLAGLTDDEFTELCGRVRPALSGHPPATITARPGVVFLTCVLSVFSAQ